MSAGANITLNTKVYAFGGSNSDTATWVDRSAGVGGGFSVVTEKFDSTPQKGAVQRMLFNLSLPVVSATDTACACAGDVLRTSSVQISIWVPQNSTLAERTDFYLRIKDLVASTPFINGVENLDPTY
jgi:hypothetical protein